MKRLIIFFIIMTGWMVQGFAQTADSENRLTEVAGADKNYLAPGNAMDTSLKLKYGLKYKLGFKGSTPQEASLSERAGAGVQPKSIFQFIVDEKSNIVECTLVESSKVDKDQTTLNFFQNNKIFDSNAVLDGKPCKSVVVFAVQYFSNGDYTIKMLKSYPLISLEDSGVSDALPADPTAGN